MRPGCLEKEMHLEDLACCSTVGGDGLVLSYARGGVGEGFAERIKDLNLTDAQEAKIAEVRRECQVKIQQAHTVLTALVKEELEKVRDVLATAQRQKLQDLKEEREERRVEGLAQGIAHLKQLDLTQDELAKIHNIQNEYHPRMVKAMEASAKE
jgi:hypothetical protein